MPPKGHKKTADGDFRPVNSAGNTIQAKQKYSIDDLLYPKSTIKNLAKETLPDDAIISKDALTAIQRAATLFVSYMASHGNASAEAGGRKKITPQDVFVALKDVDLAQFVPSVTQSVNEFEQEVAQRKKDKVVRAQDDQDHISSSESETEATEEEGNKRIRTDE
ncbi:DNA polymerase epsilon subunit D [Yarrowia lipolytica]|jgi:DNA polymerase epsilon subunit 3|uniref:DNA polymerase epsilon subunit D n=2 Tax=Yarrowia lipolytica TaxID=4952 RepID=DPB4_YARLI|nr:YALI0A05401p [Yarrowia lipolytica CLIB122]Q6CHS6.1 RecName: Full=DNA polymerase epsilon subunit D; AltName: Full=DNA polymerase II subunit D [Yarrowia lipolytica CLIB122]AOW00284.1 hypothetical protein YALI1_A05473g [Yarrowia lipolytica]KAB8284160.1 DNA polymerase epsilon subunit D [Yarrowia lipolytica]KAE8173073.1 DNA polymerase epsilon subunit D [Yarrowia lipolytica]KAJ8051393.1 DNA polymerase epsilon subunit D [Yarrowia lipolytica]QNP95093.1 DNA polymerase epsilon subunit D [Yarrowia li|eukprot:XP_499785.1 YALI0A05401p [Yarrowia lipolytica CLIB122]